MDWIPLWRDLARHPKTKRLRRELDCHILVAVGALTQLWTWAVDYATDGDISRYSDGDIADACMWDEDAGAFRAALVSAGWIDTDGRLHDWADHTGGHLAKWEAERAAAREGGERGNHLRWHVARGVTDSACPLCIAPDSPPDRPPIAPRIGSASPPNRVGVGYGSLDVDLDVDLEEPEPNPLARDELGRADVEAPDEGTAGGQQARGLIEAAPVASTPRPPAASTRLRGRQSDPPGFAEFYAAFPVHVGRGQAVRAFRAATKKADPEVIIAGAVRFAADPNLPADASKIPYPATWLNGERWLDEALPARTEGTELDQWMAEARNG